MNIRKALSNLIPIRFTTVVGRPDPTRVTWWQWRNRIMRYRTSVSES